MAYEPKEGRGSLFMNRKEKDTQPDRCGDFMLEGKRWSIAAWEEDGNRLSLRIEPYKAPQRQEGTKQPRLESDPPKARPISTDAPFDDDIPF